MTNKITKQIRCCANCEYWDCYCTSDNPDEIANSDGECHRYPTFVPNISQNMKMNVFECGLNALKNANNCSAKLTDAYLELTHGTPLLSHPFTFAGDWCGEFEPMDELRFDEAVTL